ncbi:toll/interleukin-1 receptor domain-containing protein [Tengunoibacter tsumagoiensis]|uniref:Uncharacterized protein n=1 Tax=Tengunoibacter tsumagoiensis TaxID=2014871 RepID=A0A401ZWG7_9CHLR|nr:toll/interleukin-1 receptor domain-containing protein [Tengunoibacter tsumagoiensis]GCE11156.1 hypothetical protein KTT_10150 [Tengunoibacter tsumagoiensis]
MTQRPADSPHLLFYSYSHKDELLREQLETHLRLLSRQGLIAEWHDRKLLPGTSRAYEINSYLEAASLVLVLVSPDFLASDYCYEVEMQRALERHQRGETHVIPIILRPCDWKESPLAALECLPRNGKPITQWDDQDEAFLAIAKGLRQVIEHVPLTAHPLPPLQQENRTRLMKRVRATWIDGLLNQSLQQATWLELGLQEQPDAVENPWDLLVQELDEGTRSLPAGTSISQVYDQAEGRLLILGAPGAGKTTLLLQLAKTLLERAERDALHPVPVVFVLSSWAQKRLPLQEWLIEELKVRYQIPQKIAQHWLREQRILPLLDGLDEVSSTVRLTCIKAINSYLEQLTDHSPLILTSRSAEYGQLSTLVNLRKAVSVQPLSQEQIEYYLRPGGERVAGIRHAFREDSTLAEMAKTPLLLSIFVLAYLDAPREALPVGHSHEETLHLLFAAYTRRMLRRRGKLRSGSIHLILEWLTFIARQMHYYQQTIFSLETLQAEGLPQRNQFLYRLTYPLKGALIFGLIIAGFDSLGLWLIQWQEYQTEHMPDPLGFSFHHALNDFIGIGMVASLIGAIIILPLKPHQTSKNIMAMITHGTSASSNRKTPSLDIQPSEIVHWNWSWKDLLIGMGWGLGIGGFIGLLIAPGGFLIYLAAILLFSTLIKILNLNLTGRLWQRPLKRQSFKVQLFISLLALSGVICLLRLVTSLTSLGVALIIGLPIWLIVSIYRMASGQQVLQRAQFRPNEGIRRSGKNGLLLGISLTIGLNLILDLVSWLFMPIWFGYRTNTGMFLWGSLLGTCVGLALSLYFGLNAFTQHYILRLWLWLFDYLPLKLASFLDEMSERILLRRIGGSYIFIHRFLLDYFATMTPDEQKQLAATSQTQHKQVALHSSLTLKRSIALLILVFVIIISLIGTVNLYQIGTQTRIAGTATAIALFKGPLAWHYPKTYPGSGSIALFSSLKQRDLMLPDVEDTGCQSQAEGYHVSQEETKKMTLCGYSTNFQNLAVQVQMTIVHGNCGGLLAGQHGPNTGYVFSVCQDGTYRLSKILPQGDPIDLIPTTKLPPDLSLPRQITLAVVARDKIILLYVQGKQIDHFQDSDYMQGTLALIALAQKDSTEIQYNNLRVWTITS